MTRKLLIAVPLLVIALLIAAILALPAFVAAANHRANIEALASSLTGRTVHIAGTLHLTLIPTPRLTATHITITGPNAETITARALTLDLSLPALLHGQLVADNLTFDRPDITYPWPLPGGAAAIAPPPWLAALHASLQNGRISLGAAHFTAVNAGLTTGPGGAVNLAGTGTIDDQPLTVNFALGAPDLTGTAPLALDAASNATSLHLVGGLTNASTLTGTASLTTENLTGTANITAAGAAITGTATLALPSLALTANLAAQALDLSTLRPSQLATPAFPLSLTLAATNTAFLGQTIPAFTLHLTRSDAGTTIDSLTATLPGATTLTGSLTISTTGRLDGAARIATTTLPDFLAAYGLTAPEPWPSATLAAAISGNTSALHLDHLTGRLGDASVAGTIILTAGHAAGSLAFSQLDLLPLLAWSHRQLGTAFSADGEITAAHATLGPIRLSNLLLDGGFDGATNIRRISASLYEGLAAGSVTLDSASIVTAANGFLSLPSAAPLGALIPAPYAPPAALFAPRLNVALAAGGPPHALSVAATATLGDFSATAAPVIDLNTLSAAGPITLRHPDAIRALNIWGLNRGLAWPGAGSLSLRADVIASAATYGLPNFVLSLGDLTAAGTLTSTNGAVSGHLDFDTLALPPLPSNLSVPWPYLFAAGGRITAGANRILYAGHPAAGLTHATLTAAVPQATLANAPAGAPSGATKTFPLVTLAITNTAIAGGVMTGAITAFPGPVPTITATLTATGLNADQLPPPGHFPYSLPTGLISATTSLAATGFTPDIWLATLSGSLNLTATNGSITGFSLPRLATALTSRARSAKLRAALASGTSNFQNLALSATLDHGNCTLAKAGLTGPDGAAAATGSIDLYDQDFALHLALVPAVKPPIAIGTTILGPWSAPKNIPKLKPALAWTPAA